MLFPQRIFKEIKEKRILTNLVAYVLTLINKTDIGNFYKRKIMFVIIKEMY